MKKKILSLIFVLISYVLAFVVGFYSSQWINDIYLSFFFADVIATIVIYIISAFIKNTSLYDPYWSLTPWVIATYFLIIFRVSNVYTFCLYAAFSIWSFRLTINWIITFDDLKWEDWRYKKYRETNNRFMFEVINFFGLQMMPTVLVYAATLPLLHVIEKGSSPLSLIGTAVILLGTALEFISDHEMHTFLSTTKEKVTCRRGLWKYSRHPNYLGENLVWIGVFLGFILSLPHLWYLGFGFILILLLFECISIPLMEKRQKERRSDYIDYISTTSRMFIYKKKSK